MNQINQFEQNQANREPILRFWREQKAQEQLNSETSNTENQTENPSDEGSIN